MLTAPSAHHHRDLGGGPRQNQIGADVLAAHDDVRAATYALRVITAIFGTVASE